MNRGRPRNFDRGVALERAMELFWAKGYEGTQLIDLTAVMGIKPPSFYAAFGSKEAVFREALELYERKTGSGRSKAFGDSLDTRQSIRALLEHGIDVALAAPNSGGCMVMLGMIHAGPGYEPLCDLLRSRRQENYRQVRDRLERGVREGDLPPSTEIARLATFYCATLQAISLQAHDGGKRKELVAIVDCAMKAMPEPAGGGPSTQKALPARRRTPRTSL